MRTEGRKASGVIGSPDMTEIRREPESRDGLIVSEGLSFRALVESVDSLGQLPSDVACVPLHEPVLKVFTPEQPMLRLEEPLSVLPAGAMHNRETPFGMDRRIVWMAEHPGSIDALVDQLCESVADVHRFNAIHRNHLVDMHFFKIPEVNGNGLYFGFFLAEAVCRDDHWKQIEKLARHYRWKERCLSCDMISDEHQQPLQTSRTVYIDGAVTAFVPYTASSPYEVVILPMNHVSDFSHLDRDQRRGIKETLTRIVPAIADISGPDGFEIYLRTQPLIPRHGYPEFLRGADLADVYHTGLTVRSCKGAQRIPGTERYINPVQPEHAAAELRTRISKY